MLNQIVLPKAKSKVIEIFKTEGGLQPFVDEVKREVSGFVGDASTDKGRKEIASICRKIARSKTLLDSKGKELVAEMKELPKQIDAERKRMRDQLDALKDEIGAPLEKWKEFERARVAAHEQAIEYIKDLGKIFDQDGNPYASGLLQGALDEVSQMPTSEEQCEEYIEHYKGAIAQTIVALSNAIPQARARELAEKENERMRARIAELEAQQAPKPEPEPQVEVQVDLGQPEPTPTEIAKNAYTISQPGVHIQTAMEHITIPKAEYESLLDDSHWRQCVEAAGVDNWSGYDHAMEMYHC